MNLLLKIFIAVVAAQFAKEFLRPLLNKTNVLGQKVFDPRD